MDDSHRPREPYQPRALARQDRARTMQCWYSRGPAGRAGRAAQPGPSAWPITGCGWLIRRHAGHPANIVAQGIHLMPAVQLAAPAWG